jgi:hypothetical protein
LQLGERGSVTVVEWSVTFPVLRTVILNVALAPDLIVWTSGLLTTLIAGFEGGANGAAFTVALSLSVTFSPSGDVPEALATLTKALRTFGRAQT